jgi:hypothetical protein
MFNPDPGVPGEFIVEGITVGAVNGVVVNEVIVIPLFSSV